MAFLNWLLGEVCLPVAVVAAIGLLVDVLRVRTSDLVTQIRSTRLMHHIHAYEEARSRTPGGSDHSPGGLSPSRSSGATGPGVEARSLAQTTPPPAPPNSAPSSAQAWSNQTPVGAGDSRVPAPTGPDTTGPACRTRSGSTSAPDAAASTATTGSAGCRTAKQAVTRAQRRTGHV